MIVDARGPVRLAIAVPIDVAEQRQAIEEYHRAFDRLRTRSAGATQSLSLLLLTLIALFVLFVASWLAHYLARQISAPISALLRRRRGSQQGQSRVSRQGDARWMNWRSW